MNFFISSMHLRDARLCDAYLATAENSYNDMLPTVRREVAKALGEFLEHYGYRADVLWNEQELCFSGRVIGMPRGAIVEFSGKSPTEIQDAFSSIVREYIERGASERKADEQLFDQVHGLAAE